MKNYEALFLGCLSSMISDVFEAEHLNALVVVDIHVLLLRGSKKSVIHQRQNFPDGLLDLPSENTHVMLTGICLRPQSIRHQAWTRTKIQAEQFKGGTSTYMYRTIYAPCGIKP